MSVLATNSPTPKVHSLASEDEAEARFLLRRRKQNAIKGSSEAPAVPDPNTKLWMDSFVGHCYMCQYKNRITTNGIDCPIKVAQACNAILGRSTPDQSELTEDDWKKGVEALRSYFFGMRPNGKLVIPALESLRVEVSHE